MHNINGLTAEQQSKSMSFMLTNEERLAVLTARGQRMTGYPAQQRPGTGGLVYYWPMGLQPSTEVIQELGDKDPIRAAEKFLNTFLPSDNSGAMPVARPKPTTDKPEPTKVAEEITTLSLCEFDDFLPEPGKLYRFVRSKHCAECDTAAFAIDLTRMGQELANAKG